jgi:pSer/pThr/pTyr-binding forkhead associated (FHA) protein
MPKLYVLSGPDVGKSFEIAAGALVGRDPECAVRLRDPSVSRHHARLEHDASGWSIVDTDSRNGIHLEKQRVPRAALEDGAEFTLGEVLMRFRAEAPRAADPELPKSSAPLASSVPLVSTLSPASTAPQVANARAPRVPDSDPDEIVLEGDWGASVLEPTEQTVFTPRAKTQSGAPSPGPPARPLEQPAASASGAGTRERIGSVAHPTADFAQRAGGVASANRGILQFQRVHDRPGFFNADLGQQPLWLRLAIWLLALCVFVSVAWFAFQSTSFLKSKAHHESGDAPVEENG